MKRAVFLFLFILCCIWMTACTPFSYSGNSISQTTESSNEHIATENQVSMFRSLPATNGDPITGNFDVFLSQTDAVFLYIEVQEEMTATMDFTYTTHDQSGVALGYFLEGSEDSKTVLDLNASSDSAYDTIWSNEEITLQKGMNIFYLSGDDVSCKMKFEISGIDKSKLTYLGAFPREEFIA